MTDKKPHASITKEEVKEFTKFWGMSRIGLLTEIINGSHNLDGLRLAIMTDSLTEFKINRE